MVRVISFSKEMYDNLIELVDNEEISQEILTNNVPNGNEVVVTLKVDTKIDLLGLLEDKQVEIGYDNQDTLNDTGRKLERLYDAIYYQTN